MSWEVTHIHLREKSDSRRLSSLTFFHLEVTCEQDLLNRNWLGQYVWLIVLYWCKVWKNPVLHSVYAMRGWWEWDATWLKTIKVIINSDSEACAKSQTVNWCLVLIMMFSHNGKIICCILCRQSLHVETLKTLRLIENSLCKALKVVAFAENMRSLYLLSVFLQQLYSNVTVSKRVRGW